MFKFKFDKSSLDFSDVIDGLKDRVTAAFSAAMAEVNIEARRIADEKLKSASAKQNWNRGFKLERLDDDNYLLMVEGVLANWMEEGIEVGEVSKSILGGNRAEANAAEGKHYVDVPIAKDADQAGNISLGKKAEPKINVRAFKDADALVKHINSSDWKRGGIKKKQVLNRRVQDLIHSFESQSGQVKHSYLTIRRLSANSKPWPKTPFKGAHVLDDLGSFLEHNIDRILERYL